MLAVTNSEVRPGVALVAVAGKMMLGEDSGQVDSLVGRLLDSGYQNIVFDLSGLTHIDSTGIGRFIASYNRVMQVDGASLHMAAATGIVRSAFRVTKLDTVFPFFDSVDLALAG